MGIVRHEFMAPGLSTPVTSSQCPAPAGGNILVFELNSFHFGNFFAQSVYLLLSHAKNILIMLQNSELSAIAEIILDHHDPCIA